MALLGVTKDRAPEARLDNTRFTTFWDLDFSELLAFGALFIVMPLLTLGLKLPFLLWFLTVISFPAWALLLYFVKFNDHNAAYWISKMVPFWMRQRRFRATGGGGRITPAHERLDDILVSGLNAISFEWRDAPDGITELHIYEEPLRPYRGWIEAGGRPLGNSAVEMPS